MLREVLRLAVERGTTSSEELARALDTSPELVRLMLAELVRRDYLQAVGSTACERCPLRTACLCRRQPRVWALTERSEKLIGPGLRGTASAGLPFPAAGY